MSVQIRRVDLFDDELLQRLMERNLGPSISTKHLRRQEAPGSSRAADAIRFGAFDGDRLVGLTFGQAQSASRFHMNVSLVEADYRGRGLYNRMLDSMLEATSGYDEVESKHHMLNNRILALKLRRGFHIVGFDQSILIGPRVTLRYFHNPELLALFRQRVAWNEPGA